MISNLHLNMSDLENRICPKPGSEHNLGAEQCGLRLDGHPVVIHIYHGIILHIAQHLHNT